MLQIVGCCCEQRTETGLKATGLDFERPLLRSATVLWYSTCTSYGTILIGKIWL